MHAHAHRCYCSLLRAMHSTYLCTLSLLLWVLLCHLWSLCLRPHMSDVEPLSLASHLLQSLLTWRAQSAANWCCTSLQI